MSGPVTVRDCEPLAVHARVAEAEVEITDSRDQRVGGLPVRRALPQRARRTIGAWCFLDHMGPADAAEAGSGIAPHPHIGLQTVTWLLAGEVLHRDSLGTEQLIRPGQLNLMTAGHGVAHSEELTGSRRGELHGVQFWVAQPTATRNGPPEFEHHDELQCLELEAATATVLVGELGTAASSARRDTDHLAADLEIRGRAVVPVKAHFEYGLVVVEGGVEVDGRVVTPGRLAYLGSGRDELMVSAPDPARAILVGGVPFDEPILMWWNYVARSREEIATAHQEWTDRGERFGPVASPLPAIDVGPPPWAASGRAGGAR